MKNLRKLGLFAAMSFAACTLAAAPPPKPPPPPYPTVPYELDQESWAEMIKHSVCRGLDCNTVTDQVCDRQSWNTRDPRAKAPPWVTDKHRRWAHPITLGGGAILVNVNVFPGQTRRADGTLFQPRANPPDALYYPVAYMECTP